MHAGGGHARADSTVKMITHGAALLSPQGHDHPLGCRHLHLLGDAPQRHRGPHLGASSSVRWSSRKGLACSSSSSSGDESFCTCLEHTWNLMMLCSLMRMARLVTLQPVLSGRAFFGACVCCRVSTRVVQTCAVTCHGPSTTHPSPPPTLEERGGRMLVWSDQGHSYQGQPVDRLHGFTFISIYLSIYLSSFLGGVKARALSTLFLGSRCSSNNQWSAQRHRRRGTLSA